MPHDDDASSLVSALAGTDLSNLYNVVDRDNVHGLNLAVPEDAKQVIKPWADRDDTRAYVDSGVDDQMILHVPFTEAVRIQAIVLKLGRGQTAPRHLRIYTNHPTMVDFADVETTPAHVTISLLQDEPGVVEYPLRVAAFTSVTSMSLCFTEAVGGETSRIYFLGFKGDMRNTQRPVVSELEVPAHNAAQAPLIDRVAEQAANHETIAH